MNGLDTEQIKFVPQEDSEILNQLLTFYPKAREVRRGYEGGWEKIVTAYMDSFSMQADDENFQVTSKLLFQTHSRIVNRMQRPGRVFKSDSASHMENELEIDRDGVNTVQDKGGLIDTLTSDWAIYHRQILLGYAPMMISIGDKDTPAKYIPLNLMDCYFDPSATVMRSPNGVSNVGEFLYIEQTNYIDAVARFPKTKFSGGRLPLDRDQYLDYMKKTDRQVIESEQDLVEIGHYFYVRGDKPIHAIFVGGSATIVEEHIGAKYPKAYNLYGRPAIPVVCFQAFPVPTGLYGQGLQLIYDLAIVQQRLRNLAFAHIGRNVNAINVLNVARGTSGSFANQLYSAREMQKAGEFGVILNESGDQGGFAKMEQLRTDPLTSEYERMQAELTQEIKRCGFPLDEVDRPVTETATATKAELGATTAFVQQIQEINRDAYKEVDMLTMNIIKEDFTNSKMKVITNLTEEEPIVLGDVADSLRDSEITVAVDARSGAYKTDAERQAGLRELIQATEGPERTGFLKEYARMKGIEMEAGQGVVEEPDQPTLLDTGAPAQGVAPLPS